MLYSIENLEKIEKGYERIMDIDLEDYSEKGQVRKVKDSITKLEKLKEILLTMELSEKNCISVEKICKLIIRIEKTIENSEKKLGILELFETGKAMETKKKNDKSGYIKRITLIIICFIIVGTMFKYVFEATTLKVEGAYNNSQVSRKFKENMFNMAKNRDYSSVCDGSPRNKNISVSVFDSDKDNVDYVTYLNFDHKCKYHKETRHEFEMFFTDKNGNIKNIK